jgi:hypothetical protein
MQETTNVKTFDIVFEGTAHSSGKLRTYGLEATKRF